MPPANKLKTAVSKLPLLLTIRNTPRGWVNTLATPVDKRAFLEVEHQRIKSSEICFWPKWRDSFEAFQDDIWEIVPTWPADRYLAPRDPRLGIIPGNIEGHFKRRHASAEAKPAKKRPSNAGEGKVFPSKAIKKTMVEAEKLERKWKLAEESRRWKALRSAS